MRVDSHQHFWRLDRGDYDWLTADLKPIYRDFGPVDLASLLQQHGIEASVLVQAAATVAETEYMLRVAAGSSFVRGVVGWADFDDPQAAADISRLAQDRLIKSFRPMIQDIPDPNWMLQPHLASAFGEIQRCDLAFDALLKPPHLRPFRKFLKLYPDLRIVIDHGAKPNIAASAFDNWATEMQEIARDPRVYCKLSGLVTEAGVDWTEARLRPYVDLLLEAFGPARLMWGSDWPVVNLTGSYDRWRAATGSLIAALSPAEQDAILGETAMSFYRL